MNNQSVNREISAYFSLLTPSQKESVIGLIKSFLKTDAQVSRKQYNKELSAAEKRIEKGKSIGMDSLEKESDKW